jgi:hypothetical protein
MLDSPHTSAPMLRRGTSLPQRDFHPTDHVQQDIHPTDNPPQSTLKSGAGDEEQIKDIIIITTSSRTTTGAAPELSPPKSACAGDVVLRTSTRGTVPMGQCAAPAPGAPSPWDSAMGIIEDIISQCPFLQMTYTAENPARRWHRRARNTPTSPPAPPPRPPRHVPRTHDNM